MKDKKRKFLYRFGNGWEKHDGEMSAKNAAEVRAALEAEHGHDILIMSIDEAEATPEEPPKEQTTFLVSGVSEC